MLSVVIEEFRQTQSSSAKARLVDGLMGALLEVEKRDTSLARHFLGLANELPFPHSHTNGNPEHTTAGCWYQDKLVVYRYSIITVKGNETIHSQREGRLRDAPLGELDYKTLLEYAGIVEKALEKVN